MLPLAYVLGNNKVKEREAVPLIILYTIITFTMITLIR